MRSREVIILGLILIGLQACDGWLTSMGMAQLGIESEGNGLARAAMQQFGVPAAIIGFKVFASLGVTFMVLAGCFSIKARPLVLRAFWFLAGLYAFVVWQWVEVLSSTGAFM